MVAPLIIAGAAAAGAGLLGGAMSGAMGTGDHVDPYAVNQGAYTYGGSVEEQELERRRLRALQQGAELRSAQQADYSGLAGVNDRLAFLAGEYEAAIRGQRPSVAELQLQQAQDANASQALNLAASARGGVGAQMAAQRQAQQQNALAQQRTNQQAAQLRADEQARARGEASALYTQQAGETMQQQEFNTRMRAEQTQMNDARSNALLGYQQQQQRDIMAGTMAAEDARRQAYQDATRTNVEIDEAGRKRKQAFWGGLLGGGGSALAAGAR